MSYRHDVTLRNAQFNSTAELTAKYVRDIKMIKK